MKPLTALSNLLIAACLTPLAFAQANLAWNQPASQSSTWSSGTGASNAVDGNTYGAYVDGSISHTNLESTPWWQVDLGSSATIYRIVIWNRTDCCSARLGDYWVFVSNTPFAANDTPATLQGRAATWSSHQTSAPNLTAILTTGGVPGRYVRVQLSGVDYLHLTEVQVYGAPLVPAPNLALGQAAAQSSTQDSGTGASKAVDGNTDGAYADGSITHTTLEANPWWQVDLGTPAALENIVIWNRTDCCQERLSDYWVFVSNTPFAATDTPSTLQARAGTWSSHQTSAPSPAVTLPTTGVQGQYVRVQLSGTNYLHLAEVQVFGSALLPFSDLAAGRPASQSSTLTAGMPANRAVDGNADGAYADGSIAHTSADANAWWQVDLGGSTALSSLVIWNRTDCCPERLSDYWVFASNTPFQPGDTPATLQNRSGTWSSHRTAYPNPSTTIAAGGAVGQYVRVQESGTQYLSLAEVQAFGTIAWPPANFSVTPASGSGASQTFAVTSSSPNGYGGVAWMEMLWNYSEDGAGGCYVHYVPASNTISLAADNGAWGAGVVMGSSGGSLENGQCRLNLGASWVNRSFNAVTLNLAVSFLAGLPGLQNVYLATGDNSGLSAPWQQMGTWTGTTPTSSEPTSLGQVTIVGTGLVQTFSYEVSNANGYSYIMQVHALIGSTGSDVNACYVWLDRAGNYLGLLSDAGWAGGGQGGTPGVGGILSNSQCDLDTNASSVVGSGNTLTLNLALRFHASWAGAKNIYLLAWDRAQIVGPLSKGAWTVGEAVSIPISTIPAGLSLTFDGAPCTAPCTVSWIAGSTHTIAAAQAQSLGGVPYTFTSWSDGGALSHSVTAAAGLSLTATFTRVLPTTTIQSVPAGLTFTVDNLGCVSPCLMKWTPGTSHTISAGTQVMGGNTQYVFVSWSQGTGASQIITAPSADFTYTAAFTAQYAVSAFVGPSAAGNVTLTPAGGWYAAGTQVTVGAVVNPGWAFTNFTGGLNSAVAPQVLTVNAPVTLTANFTPDFSLAIPTPVTAPIHGSVQFPITVTGQNGFSDTITFDAPVLPTGASASFSTVNGVPTVTMTAPPAGGTFAFTLRGTTSSGLTHGVAGSFAVQDFTATALTPPQSAGVGDTVQYLFAIGPLGGFNGNVTLAPVSLVNDNSPPPPFNPLPNCSLDGSSQQYAGGVLTLTFTTSSFGNQCPAGDYHIDATFNSGTIYHTVTVQLHVAYTGLITITSPLPPQFSGAVATFRIHVTSKVSGQSVTFPTAPIAGCGAVLTRPSPLTTPDDTTFTLDTSACAANMYWVIVFALPLNGTQQSLAIPLYVGGTAPPDFSITPTPSTQTVIPGASTLYTLNVAPINGFSQQVSLTTSGLPSGVIASFPNGSSVNSFGTVALRVDANSSTASGTFTVTVTATGGGLTRSTTLTLNVVQPQPQTGYTLGTISATTVPADGTVVAVPLQITPLNGSSATVTVRSISHVPTEMNVTVSAHTLMISAASTVPTGSYFLEYEGDDGNGGISRGGGPVGVGGGGLPPPHHAPVIDSPNSLNPATLIAGQSGDVTITGSYFGALQGYLTICLPSWDPYWPGDPLNAPPCFPAGMIWGPSYFIPSNGWSDNTIHATVTMPPLATGDWNLYVRSVNWVVGGTDYASAGHLKVYSPLLSGPTSVSVQNNQQDVASGPYYVYVNTPLPTSLDASNVTCATSGSGISTEVFSPSDSDPANQSSFDLVFASNASGPIQAGAHTVTCSLGATPVPSDSGPITVTLYDANPVITSVQQYPSDSSDGSFPVLISGRNFGSSGQLLTCTPTASVCNGTPDLTVVGTPPWNDQSISARLKPSAAAVGDYFVVVTSGGMSGNGFLGSPGDQAGSLSNPGKVTVRYSGVILTLTRVDLTTVRAFGSPAGGTYAVSAPEFLGGNDALPLANPTITQDAQSATVTLIAPNNPDAKGNPYPGALEQFSITYTAPSGGGRAVAQFSTAFFGMSCYIKSLETDWLKADGTCRSQTWPDTRTTPPTSVRYQGSVTNPVKITTLPGQTAGQFLTDPNSLLKGTFCATFLKDLEVQGSGETKDGNPAHLNTATLSFETGLQNTTDGTAPVAGETVARDKKFKKIIPQKGVMMNLTWPDPSKDMHADDTGKRGFIDGYRLDIYGGNGNSACAPYSGNRIVIGVCKVPGISTCPVSAIQ